MIVLLLVSSVSMSHIFRVSRFASLSDSQNIFLNLKSCLRIRHRKNQGRKEDSWESIYIKREAHPDILYFRFIRQIRNTISKLFNDEILALPFDKSSNPGGGALSHALDVESIERVLVTSTTRFWVLNGPLSHSLNRFFFLSWTGCPNSLDSLST